MTKETMELPATSLTVVLQRQQRTHSTGFPARRRRENPSGQAMIDLCDWLLGQLATTRLTPPSPREVYATPVKVLTEFQSRLDLIARDTPFEEFVVDSHVMSGLLPLWLYCLPPIHIVILVEDSLSSTRLSDTILPRQDMLLRECHLTSSLIALDGHDFEVVGRGELTNDLAHSPPMTGNPQYYGHERLVRHLAALPAKVDGYVCPDFVLQSAIFETLLREEVGQIEPLRAQIQQLHQVDKTRVTAID